MVKDRVVIFSKTNISLFKKKIKVTLKKEYTSLAGILVAAILPLYVYSTQTVFSQSQILEVAVDDLIAPIGGMVSWYTFSVPEEAVNPRLVGHYEVLNGLDIDVTVLDQEGCPAPENAFECISIYSAPGRDSGDVDVALTPGKTYYLEFHNPGFLAGERTTQVDFDVVYD
jgi:hypothetical protein